MTKCQLKVASLVSRSRNQQHLAIVLVTGLMLLFAPTAAAQKRPSDVEMKEVVRTLIEREVPRPADGGIVTVLLDPNVRPGWIPEVPSVAIRQLSYDEWKLVPEFYGFSWNLKGSVLTASLARGNYCRSSGRQYEFRRRSGAWQSKIVGEIEATAGGTRCDGCVTGSGATYAVRRRASNPPASPPRKSDLRLTGSAGKISCSKKENYILCQVGLNLKFTNTSSTPVIILQPHSEYEFWYGASSLALSEQESRANSFVYDSAGWPSVYRFPIYEALANLLDQSAPPEGATRVLPPNGSWDWHTTIRLGFSEGNRCSQRVGVEIGWNEIKRRTAPLWLRVSYEMWPINVENFKPNLGGILKKRWQRHGSLYLEEKIGGRWWAHLTSEPMEISLNNISLNE